MICNAYFSKGVMKWNFIYRSVICQSEYEINLNGIEEIQNFCKEIIKKIINNVIKAEQHHVLFIKRKIRIQAVSNIIWYKKDIIFEFSPNNVIYFLHNITI